MRSSIIIMVHAAFQPALQRNTSPTLRCVPSFAIGTGCSFRDTSYPHAGRQYLSTIGVSGPITVTKYKLVDAWVFSTNPLIWVNASSAEKPPALLIGTDSTMQNPKVFGLSVTFNPKGCVVASVGSHWGFRLNEQGSNHTGYGGRPLHDHSVMGARLQSL